jgi:hypothetical protein
VFSGVIPACIFKSAGQLLENGLVLFAMSRTPLKQVDLWRFLPVSVGLSVGVYLATSRLPYVISLVSALSVVALLGIQIRLGRFPWFETKDGKKHPFTRWLEAKLPFLSEDFYRR